MNKIILVFIGSIFAINSFAQTFRNEFDRYEFYAGGQGQGFSFHSNVRGELNNAESIYLEAYIEMFKATKDKRYLDKLEDLVKEYEFAIKNKHFQEIPSEEEIIKTGANIFRGWFCIFVESRQILAYNKITKQYIHYSTVI